MRDTQLEAESVRLAAIRRTPPAVRVRQAFDLSEMTRRLAIAALRQRHPGRSEFELVELMIGARVASGANSRNRP